MRTSKNRLTIFTTNPTAHAWKLFAADGGELARSPKVYATREEADESAAAFVKAMRHGITVVHL